MHTLFVRRLFIFSFGSAVLLAVSGASRTAIWEDVRRACREMLQLEFRVDTCVDDPSGGLENVVLEGKDGRVPTSPVEEIDADPPVNQHLLALLVVAGLAFGVAACRVRS